MICLSAITATSAPDSNLEFEQVGQLFGTILDCFKVTFTMYGFTFSLWDIFLLSAVVSIIGAFIGWAVFK